MSHFIDWAIGFVTSNRLQSHFMCVSALLLCLQLLKYKHMTFSACVQHTNSITSMYRNTPGWQMCPRNCPHISSSTLWQVWMFWQRLFPPFWKYPSHHLGITHTSRPGFSYAETTYTQTCIHLNLDTWIKQRLVVLIFTFYKACYFMNSLFF